LGKLALFQQSQHIACYLPYKSEFDSLPAIDMIWREKKDCYVPVLAPKQEQHLCFVHYAYGDALRKNVYSILEPVNINEQIAPDALDLVIVPLLAFDAEGHRLGTGGGYYDRTFAGLREKSDKRPQFIGLAYKAQQAEALPADPWDIALDGVVTEEGFLICTS
jgi:5-formyltetrahydrofolate cyclo-ligase